MDCFQGQITASGNKMKKELIPCESDNEMFLTIKLGQAYKALRDIVDCANTAGELPVDEIIAIIEENGICVKEE